MTRAPSLDAVCWCYVRKHPRDEFCVVCEAAYFGYCVGRADRVQRQAGVFFGDLPKPEAIKLLRRRQLGASHGMTTEAEEST